jgi:signal transduction histidine kinase
MNIPPELAGDLLRAQRTLVLRRLFANAFEILGPGPEWFAHDPKEKEILIGKTFPFLGIFLPEAEAVWAEPEAGPAQSDLWTESTPSGEDVHLSATAVRGEAGDLLLINPVEKHYEELRGTLQQARELMLSNEQREREQHLRELTVHCLVHDLIGNLAISRVIFDEFERRLDLSPNDRERLAAGREAARGVSNHLRDMVDLYSAELKAIAHFETAADRAPDLLDCVTEELIQVRPIFDARHLVLDAEMPDDISSSWPVYGERGKLRRIIFNLLENALRHAPDGTRVKVEVAMKDGFGEFAVADEGPGVAPDLADRVFERFVGGDSGGKAGLGLFFVRSTVERWGGTVWHEANPAGGATFRFRLPLATGG